jgi:hypothetical protein
MSAFKVQRSAVAKTAAGSYGSTAASHFADLTAVLRSFELDYQAADILGNPRSAIPVVRHRQLPGISLSISSAQGDKEPAAVVKAEIDALVECNIL